MFDSKRRVFSIRGATTIESNSESEIASASVRLIDDILLKNSIEKKDIVNIIISSTADITASYPAKAVREHDFSDVPIFSCIEPEIENSLPLCIRVLITIVSFVDDFNPLHVYLNKAKALRPDLTEGKS